MNWILAVFFCFSSVAFADSVNLADFCIQYVAENAPVSITSTFIGSPDMAEDRQWISYTDDFGDFTHSFPASDADRLSSWFNSDIMVYGIVNRITHADTTMTWNDIGGSEDIRGNKIDSYSVVNDVEYLSEGMWLVTTTWQIWGFPNPEPSMLALFGMSIPMVFRKRM